MHPLGNVRITRTPSFPLKLLIRIADVTFRRKGEERFFTRSGFPRQSRARGFSSAPPPRFGPRSFQLDSNSFRIRVIAHIPSIAVSPRECLDLGTRKDDPHGHRGRMAGLPAVVFSRESEIRAELFRTCTRRPQVQAASFERNSTYNEKPLIDQLGRTIPRVYIFIVRKAGPGGSNEAESSKPSANSVSIRCVNYTFRSR